MISILCVDQETIILIFAITDLFPVLLNAMRFVFVHEFVDIYCPEKENTVVIEIDIYCHGKESTVVV